MALAQDPKRKEKLKGDIRRPCEAVERVGDGFFPSLLQHIKPLIQQPTNEVPKYEASPRARPTGATGALTLV